MHHDYKKDFIWNTLGVFTQNAISPLLLIVITRVNGIYDSGLFSFAFSISIIFWVVSMWGGRTYQVSDIKRTFTSKEYISIRFIFGGLVLLASIVFSLVNQYDFTKIVLITMLVFFKVIESIADSMYGVLQVNGILYKAGKSLLLKAIVGLGLFFILDMYLHNVIISFAGILVVNIVVVIFYDLSIVKEVEDFSKESISTYNILQIIKVCFPLVAVSFLTSFSLNIPRYFIDCYHNQDMGYFGIIAMPTTLMGLVIMFIMQPNIVQLSNLYNQGLYRDFRKIVTKIITVAIIVGLGVLVAAYVAGPFILNLIFAVDFYKYRIALTILTGGAIIGSLVSILTNILIILRKFNGQLYVLFFTNLLLAVFSPFVVGKYATLGAVILFSITNMLQLILLTFIYKLHLGSDIR